MMPTSRCVFALEHRRAPLLKRDLGPDRRGAARRGAGGGVAEA